jgi:hypothetical protein
MPVLCKKTHVFVSDSIDLGIGFTCHIRNFWPVCWRTWCLWILHAKISFSYQQIVVYINQFWHAIFKNFRSNIGVPEVCSYWMPGYRFHGQQIAVHIHQIMACQSINFLWNNNSLNKFNSGSGRSFTKIFITVVNVYIIIYFVLFSTVTENWMSLQHVLQVKNKKNYK